MYIIILNPNRFNLLRFHPLTWFFNFISDANQTETQLQKLHWITVCLDIKNRVIKIDIHLNKIQILKLIDRILILDLINLLNIPETDQHLYTHQIDKPHHRLHHKIYFSTIDINPTIYCYIINLLFLQILLVVHN